MCQLDSSYVISACMVASWRYVSFHFSFPKLYIYMYMFRHVLFRSSRPILLPFSSTESSVATKTRPSGTYSSVPSSSCCHVRLHFLKQKDLSFFHVHKLRILPSKTTDLWGCGVVLYLNNDILITMHPCNRSVRRIIYIYIGSNSSD